MEITADSTLTKADSTKIAADSTLTEADSLNKMFGQRSVIRHWVKRQDVKRRAHDVKGCGFIA